MYCNNLLPPCSEERGRWGQQIPTKHYSLCTRTHGVTPQKTVPLMSLFLQKYTVLHFRNRYPYCLLFLFVVVLLCIVLLSCVYFCYLMCIVLQCVYCCLAYFSCRMLARSQYPKGLATGHLGTGFFWFSCV
jgi:hypothetical protein